MHDMLDMTSLSDGKIENRNDHFILKNALTEIIELVRYQSLNRRVKIEHDLKRLVEHRIVGDKNRL